MEGWKKNCYAVKLVTIMMSTMWWNSLSAETKTGLTLSGNVGRTIATSQSYETLNFTHAIVQPKGSFLYIAKGHYLNNANWAANLGISIRKTKAQRLIGVNFFYDTLNIEKTYHQAGMGIELLAKTNSFRINIYQPIGNRAYSKLCARYDYPGGYSIVQTDRKAALSGVDVEYSKKLSFFEIGVGGYGYIPKRSKSKTGGKIRITSSLGRYWTLQALASYDSNSHMLVQGTLSFSIPFFGNDTDTRYYQPVYRQDIILRGSNYYPWCTNY